MLVFVCLFVFASLPHIQHDTFKTQSKSIKQLSCPRLCGVYSNEGSVVPFRSLQSMMGER